LNIQSNTDEKPKMTGDPSSQIISNKSSTLKFPAITNIGDTFGDTLSVTDNHQSIKYLKQTPKMPGNKYLSPNMYSERSVYQLGEKPSIP
jgi:hypothetical protein